MHLCSLPNLRLVDEASRHQRGNQDLFSHKCQILHSKGWRFLTFHTSYNSFNKWTKISSLEITIFDWKMMVKSGLDIFILKFTKPLQRYLLTCQANSAFLGSSLVKFKIIFPIPLFTTTFKQKMSISWIEILVHL